MISIEHRPRLVHQDGPIAVTIVGDPDVSLVFQHRRLHHLWIEGAAPIVDVHPIGLDIHRDDHCPELPENRGGYFVRGPVTTIYHDLEAVKGKSLGHGPLDKLDVPARRVVDPIGLADFTSQRAELLDLPVDDQRLHPLLHLIRNFESFPREKLNSVVLKGIV